MAEQQKHSRFFCFIHNFCFDNPFIVFFTFIGHGHYGTVRLASLVRDKTKKFAVKSISKQKIKKDLHLFKRELEILKSLDHPNVIKFYETYQDNKHFHLVMEVKIINYLIIWVVVSFSVL